MSHRSTVHFFYFLQLSRYRRIVSFIIMTYSLFIIIITIIISINYYYYHYLLLQSCSYYDVTIVNVGHFDRHLLLFSPIVGSFVVHYYP